MILDEIMTYKRQELKQRKTNTPLAELEARGSDRPPPIDFATGLRGGRVRLIAEVKRASPSKGLFRPDLDPVELATTYAANGAAAISVLTDERFFQGQLAYLANIAATLRTLQSPIPILRKDFIFDPYQVFESFAYGADALLLIVSVLSDGVLDRLLSITRALGMTALVEVHDEREMERALPMCPRVIGVNNRNLYDFGVDLNTFGRLRPLIPGGTVAVAESGVHTAADVDRLAKMGADAILVGEALVTAPDTATKVRELAWRERSDRVHVVPGTGARAGEP